MPHATTIVGEATIWTRVIDAFGMTPESARLLLTLRFREEDRLRIDELASRNQEGLLTDAERQELEAYSRVADVLALLHLKARGVLKAKPSR